MLRAAVSARPARIATGLAVCAMLLVSMLAYASSAPASSTVKVKANVQITDVLAEGNQTRIVGRLVGGALDGLDLSGQEIKIKVDKLVCVATTNKNGFFNCLVNVKLHDGIKIEIGDIKLKLLGKGHLLDLNLLGLKIKL